MSPEDAAKLWRMETYNTIAEWRLQFHDKLLLQVD